MEFWEGQSIGFEGGTFKIGEVTGGSVTARLVGPTDPIEEYLGESLDNYRDAEGKSGTGTIEEHSYHYEITMVSGTIAEMVVKLSKEDFEGLLREGGAI